VIDITVASEVMAILCLPEDLSDLQQRLGDMIVAYTPRLQNPSMRAISSNAARPCAWEKKKNKKKKKKKTGRGEEIAAELLCRRGKQSAS